jgi:hypothetical protein
VIAGGWRPASLFCDLVEGAAALWFQVEQTSKNQREKNAFTDMIAILNFRIAPSIASSQEHARARTW